MHAASHEAGNSQIVTLDGAALWHDDALVTAVRWDSPTLAGLTVAASYAPDGGTPVWDAALRWSGTAGKLDATFAAAYRNDGGVKSVVVSGGLREHIVGLFVQAAYNRDEADNNALIGQAGWSHNPTGLGDTTLYAEAGKYWSGTFSGQPDMIGAGIQQQLTGASATLYLGWRRVGGIDSTDDRVAGGMTVRF